MYEGNQSLKKATAGNGTGICPAPSSGTPPPGKTGGGYYFLKSFGKCSSALSQNKESKFTVPVHLSGRKITPRLLTPNFESIPAGKKLNDIPGKIFILPEGIINLSTFSQTTKTIFSPATILNWELVSLKKPIRMAQRVGQFNSR